MTTMPSRRTQMTVVERMRGRLDAATVDGKAKKSPPEFKRLQGWMQ
jgi:hypothetical protein